MGAVSTGTHGTGSHVGNMASQVLGLRVLDSQGNLRVINETTNAEELKSIILHERFECGMSGEAYSMTMVPF